MYISAVGALSAQLRTAVVISGNVYNWDLYAEMSGRLSFVRRYWLEHNTADPQLDSYNWLGEFWESK